MPAPAAPAASCGPAVLAAPDSPALPPLPAVRLRLTVRADGPLPLPPYAGSMLRGALGHALMDLAALPHASGQACALRESCTYCQVFAPVPQTAHSLQKFSQMPAPYVIEPPFQMDSAHTGANANTGADSDTDAGGACLTLRKGETFSFGLVLIGRALQHLPTLTLAFARACQRGLGPRHTPCSLLSIEHEQPAGSAAASFGATFAPAWRPGQGAPALPARAATLPAPAALAGSASLQLLTPLRLQLNNRPAKAHELTARALLVTLARRCQLLMDTQLGPGAPQLDFAALAAQAEAIRLDASGLRWFNWARYSSRQRQAMNLGGLLGTLHLHGQQPDGLAPFAGLLYLGQWLHAGKETTFGLGLYALTALADAASAKPPAAPAFALQSP